jgi:protein arginine N-methyltransferase 1
VVLDLGCGTGILGLLALRAGARRVHAVDPGPVLDVAREAFASAGWADRVVLHRGLSTRVRLPRRVDVVLSDHAGCFGVDYGILEAFADARRRHLRRGGTLVPSSLRMEVALARCPEVHRLVAAWRRPVAGFRFPGAAELAAAAPRFARIARGDLASAPRVLARVDLARAADGPVEGTVRLVATRRAVVHGIAGWARTTLAPGVTMSNSPLDPRRIARSPVLLPFPRPLRVRRGDRVEAWIRHHPARGAVAWRVRGRAGGRPFAWTASTLLALPPDPAALALSLPGTRPRLGPRARAIRRALDLAAAGTPVGRIRRALRRHHPAIFPSERAAADFLAPLLVEAAS